MLDSSMAGAKPRFSKGPKIECDTRCIICDGIGHWKNIDEYRFKPQNMAICSHCGFVSYPLQWKSEEEIKKYYRSEYRQPPTVQHLYSGQRKIHFHHNFLAPLFEEWKKEGREEIVISEIGAAFGLFLKWVKHNFPKAEVSGTELTLTYRRVAYHEYGITLTEDFDFTKQYDLITSYKVAEHQMDVDKKLIAYKECLKPNGLFYISVPTWFEVMQDHGSSTFALDNWYHPNHINTWSRKLFETLLKKVGLEIIKEDHIMYNDTYLCKRNDELMKEKRVYEDWNSILERMGNIKKAAEAMEEGRYADAMGHWPNFPIAHMKFYEANRNPFHQEGFDWIEANVIQRMVKECPQSVDSNFMAADICMRYSRWDSAIDYLGKSLDMVPLNNSALQNLAQCFRQKSIQALDLNSKYGLLIEARNMCRKLQEVSLQNIPDAITWAFHDNAHLPMPNE